MTQLLKSFGKGLLYIFVLPALLVVLAVYAVLGVGMFLFVAVKGAILFFTGRTFGELPEDIKARAILEGTDDVKESVQIEEATPEKPSNDFASNYFIPFDQSIPTPKEEEHVEPQPENKEPDNNGGEQ